MECGIIVFIHWWVEYASSNFDWKSDGGVCGIFEIEKFFLAPVTAINLSNLIQSTYVCMYIAVGEQAGQFWIGLILNSIGFRVSTLELNELNPSFG